MSASVFRDLGRERPIVIDEFLQGHRRPRLMVMLTCSSPLSRPSMMVALRGPSHDSENNHVVAPCG